MTNEEALTILQDGVLSGSADTPQNNDAVEMAIYALEKQTPKKPFKNRTEYYCPTCEEEKTCVGKNRCDGYKSRNAYCFNCGQAIDWSE